MLALLLVGCSTTPTSDNATDTKSVALPYSSPEIAGELFDSLYTSLDAEYDVLHARRTEAYATHDRAQRDSLLCLSNVECELFATRLRETDSMWRATARYYYDLRDSSFTRLCLSRDIDSAHVAANLW